METNTNKRNILLLGESCVGKTAILNRYCKHNFKEEDLMTVGIDFKTKIRNYDNSEIIFQYWDTSGQEKYQAVNKNFYRKADVIIFVFDLTCRRSFQKIICWYHEVKDTISIDSVQKILIGNKCDLIDKLEISQDSIDELVSIINTLRYFCTSAKDNINIDECFNYLEEKILQKTIINYDTKKIHYISLSKQKEKQNKKC